MRTIQLSEEDEKELVFFFNDVIERRGPFARDPLQHADRILTDFSERATVLKEKLLK